MRTILMISCLAAGYAAAQTVTLTPTKDSDVYSFMNAPTSTMATLGVSATPQGNASVHSQRSLIQFNLSGVTIPAADVGKAVLRLYTLAPEPMYGSIAAGTVYVHRQGTNWGNVSATTPTWSVFQSAGVVATFPITTSSPDSWVEVDVTPLAVAWLSGTANHGIYLAPEADVMASPLNVSFASMEVPGYRPELVITRRVVPPVLSLSTQAGMVTLRWPVSGSTGWVLKKSENLTGTWTAPTATASVVGTEWVLQEALGTRGFYRLEK